VCSRVTLGSSPVRAPGDFLKTRFISITVISTIGVTPPPIGFSRGILQAVQILIHVRQMEI